jgi:hypothetical protein
MTGLRAQRCAMTVNSSTSERPDRARPFNNLILKGRIAAFTLIPILHMLIKPLHHLRQRMLH